MSTGREQDFADFFYGTWHRTVSCADGMTADLSAAGDWLRKPTVGLGIAGGKFATTTIRAPGSDWSPPVLLCAAPAVFAQQSTTPRGPRLEPVAATIGRHGRARGRANAAARAQRRAVVLQYLGDLSVSVIATTEGCPEGTVKGQLSRGRTVLAGLLGATAESDGEASHA